MPRGAAAALSVCVVALATAGSMILYRTATRPGCTARFGEVCAVSGGMRFVSVSRVTGLEIDTITFDWRDASGASLQTVVSRSNALGVAEQEPSKAQVQVRRWDGSNSDLYTVHSSPTAVTIKVCVESWLGPRCASSGALTRLGPYRG